MRNPVIDNDHPMAVICMRYVVLAFLTLMLIEETVSQYQDHYKILGIEKTAVKKDVKKAYIRLSLKWHPDKNKDKKRATQEMQRINAAYETLSNAERRAEYDQEREHGYSFESFSDFDWDFNWRSTIKKRANDILTESNIDSKYEYSFGTETANGAWLVFMYDDDDEGDASIEAARAFTAAAKVSPSHSYASLHFNVTRHSDLSSKLARCPGGSL